jgi:phosphatidylglycerol:prolipoprotein diacylglycerol transferase
MHRIILDLGCLSITSWGVMLVVAFIAGIWLAERRAARYGIAKSVIPDLAIVLIVAGVVGGRVMFIVENWSYFAKCPGEIIKVWEGGLCFQGGLGLAILSGIIFVKKKHVSVFKAMDVVAPSVALGLAFARIGCFLNGCCFGKPTNLPWGLIFPPDSPPRWVFDATVRVHPTQLYSCLAGVCICLIILLIEKKKTQRPQAYLFGVLLGLYGTWRFSIDFLRYYEPEIYLFPGFTHYQLISVVMIVVSFFFVFRREPAP